MRHGLRQVRGHALAAGLGILFLLPRFTRPRASLSHPFGRIVTRITGHDRNI